MNLSALFNSIGSSSLFSTRIFLPALLMALLLRFGPDVPIIQHLGLLAYLQHGHPTWFTSNTSLIVLTALSILEILAQKNPEARKVLQEIDIYIKPAMAILASFGFISSENASFVGRTVHTAGYSDAIFPLISAVLTWRLSILRQRVATALFDHLDGTGLDKLISWLEEAWTVFGVFLLFLFPLLMILMIAAATGAMYALRKRLEYVEDHSKIPCSKCGTMIYPCAVACGSCRQANATPHEVGFLGQSKQEPASDPANQMYRLAEKRRCSVCAARLPARRPKEPCCACGDASACETKFAQAYASYIGQRLPIVLLVSFLMSLVPILGLIVATVFFRMEIVLPFSQYLPLGRNFLLRWGIRLLFLVLIFLQIIPLLGGIVAPLMAYISYSAYRSSYLSLMESPHIPAAQPALVS
jgi:Domain of unknown function (DUF4126)